MHSSHRAEPRADGVEDHSTGAGACFLSFSEPIGVSTHRKSDGGR
jgi:hypothetical protein